MKELSQLFTVSTGYTFRDAIARLGAGEVGVVQSGDITSANLSGVARVTFDKADHLLRVDDILLSSRGKFVARTVTADLLPAVASSSVIILRPISAGINSRFVARFLNSTRGQELLSRLESGSYIKTLRVSDLKTIKVPQPPITEQQTVMKLHDNLIEQQKLLNLKNQLLKNIDDNLIAKLQGDAK